MSVARNNSRIRRARESSTSLRSSVFDVAREIGLADPKASRWIYDDEVLEESHQEPIIEEEEGEEEEVIYSTLPRIEHHL